MSCFIGPGCKNIGSGYGEGVRSIDSRFVTVKLLCAGSRPLGVKVEFVGTLTAQCICVFIASQNMTSSIIGRIAISRYNHGKYRGLTKTIYS